MSSKRVSTLPPAPKPPTTLSPSLTIDSTAVLTGTHPIILGNNTIIHPRTRFTSTHGPITVGNGCIIGERVAVGLKEASSNQAEGVNIENGVMIEVGATVEARVIGEGSLVEVNAVIGRGSIIGKVRYFLPYQSLPRIQKRKKKPDRINDKWRISIARLAHYAP